MRALPLILALFPTLVLADDIPLTSKVTDVTLYPNGAKIVRHVPFSAPAGTHQLQLIDLPAGTPTESLRVAIMGGTADKAPSITLGAVTIRHDFVPPRADTDTPEIEAAEDAIEQIETTIHTKKIEAETIRLAHDAANTRIGFLKQIGRDGGLADATSDTLRDISRMIGEETLAARQAALTVDTKAREIDREIDDLNDDLRDAEQHLRALTPEIKERLLVVVDITSLGDDAQLTLTYNTQAGEWAPVYDAMLTRAPAAFELIRGAFISQTTGENWTDVNLTLSTNRPSAQTNPSTLYPNLRRIMDPVLRATKRVLNVENEEMAFSDMAAPSAKMMLESPAPERMATVNLDGLGVTYTYPTPVSLASNADAVRIKLGSLTLDPDIGALAVPMHDETAFLVADFTNDTGEIILPSAQTQYFVDGEFIGSRPTDAIAAGATAQLSFGPINGLRLKRIVENRNTGDRGIITKSNEQSESIRIEVENLTGETWPLRIIDRVPYSEQEDLSITWNASPKPSEHDVDDKRGILSWDVEIAPGASETLRLSHTIEWPDGTILR